MARNNNASNGKEGTRFQGNQRGKKDKEFKRSRDYKGDSKCKRDAESISREAREARVSQNDPTWYYRDPSTLRAYANYPFNLPAGFALRIDGGNAYMPESGNPQEEILKSEYVVPGIMVNGYIPWIGHAKTAKDPINLAAQSIYTYVRSANSGAKNYEPTDIAIYLMAMDSLYCAYTIMVRAYGTLYAYNPMNRYMPKALFEAQGFDYNDFISNIADFKAYIDLCRSRISQLVVPSGMSYFQRHAALNANIFADSTVAKSQFILFKPTGLWKYEGYSDRKGGKVVYVNTGFVGESQEELMTFAELRTLVDELISRVVNDVDCGIISGDLLKAYGNDLYLLPVMPSDYSISIQPMDRWMASQLHNAMFLGNPISMKIEQVDSNNPNVPRLINSEARFDYHQLQTIAILDLDTNDPTPEDVLEATRFMYACERDATIDTEAVVVNAASEILTECQILQYDGLSRPAYRNYTTVIEGVGEGFLNACQDIMVNNIAPILYIRKDGIANTFTISHILGYLDNCVNFELSKLTGLNTMALDTMFTTSMSGKYNSK